MLIYPISNVFTKYVVVKDLYSLLKHYLPLNSGRTIFTQLIKMFNMNLKSGFYLPFLMADIDWIIKLHIWHYQLLHLYVYDCQLKFLLHNELNEDLLHSVFIAALFLEKEHNNCFLSTEHNVCTCSQPDFFLLLQSMFC